MKSVIGKKSSTLFSSDSNGRHFLGPISQNSLIISGFEPVALRHDALLHEDFKTLWQHEHSRSLIAAQTFLPHVHSFLDLYMIYI